MEHDARSSPEKPSDGVAQMTRIYDAMLSQLSMDSIHLTHGPEDDPSQYGTRFFLSHVRR